MEACLVEENYVYSPSLLEEELSQYGTPQESSLLGKGEYFLSLPLPPWRVQLEGEGGNIDWPPPFTPRSDKEFGNQLVYVRVYLGYLVLGKKGAGRGRMGDTLQGGKDEKELKKG